MPDPIPDAGCLGKHPFNNRRDANTAIRNHVRRGVKTLHAYRCLICECWHVGGKKPRPPKPKQRGVA